VFQVLQVAPWSTAVELQWFLVLAVLEEHWAISVFSPPWGATGLAAGKACLELRRECRLN